MAKPKLIALLGEPPSLQAALDAIDKLSPDAAIVSDNDVAFTAAVMRERLRTRDRVRSAEAIAACADEVVDFSAKPKAKTKDDVAAGKP